MTLDQWATAAEIVAGFGLIISLIFVGWQMRVNSLATQADYIGNHMRAYDDILSFFLSDPELPDIWIAAEDDAAAMSRRDRLKYTAYLMKVFNHADVWANLDRRLFVGDFGQGRYEEDVKSMLSTPARRAWWRAHASSFSPIFQEEVKRLVPDASKGD